MSQHIPEPSSACALRCIRSRDGHRRSTSQTQTIGARRMKIVEARMKIDISSYGICERFSTVAVLLLVVGCSRSTASSLPATNSFPPLKSSQQVHLHGTKTAKRTKSDDGNEIMVEGADKTSINVLAPSVPAVLCAIKQAPSAITSPANTCLCVNSPHDLTCATGTFLSDNMTSRQSRGRHEKTSGKPP